MNAEQLLRRADEILDGTPQASPRRMRIAAFLIRQALEVAVGIQCQRLVGRIDHPVRMRSRLLVLHALDDSGFASRAEHAWNALSGACHHHAYELAPTLTELLHLHLQVTNLVAASTSTHGSRSTAEAEVDQRAPLSACIAEVAQ